MSSIARLQQKLGRAFPNHSTAATFERTILNELPHSKPKGSIRIASLNTLHQGTADSDRGPLIRELFKFVDADVYCFNEEWEEAEFISHVESVLPKRDAKWNIYWSRSRGIVSTLALNPKNVACPNATAAILTLPDGSEFAVVSIHLECCGYDGSEQDKLRVQEATEIAADIKDVVGVMPLVVLGDYNLVGSRDPLNILEEAGLEAVLLRSPIDGSALTWRGIENDSSFWPGRLDYATKNKHVKFNGGFTLTANSLRQWLGEEVGPRASDHAMLVLDISREP